VSYIKAVKYHQHYHAEEQSGICVVRRKDETVEDLLKRFRKKYSKSGVSKEIRDRMYFEKPSDKKRRKRAQSIRNIKREMEKEEILREKMDTKKQKGGSFNRTRYGDQNDSSSSR
jgi:small subunit ribosomal protein S21